MARKKEEVKPLLALKRDFVASLDNAINEAMLLLQTVEFALRYGGDQLYPDAKKQLAERAKAFRAAISTEG